MHRPARPKSAKGRVRPTPHSRPTVRTSTTSSSTSGASNNQRHAPQPSTSGRSTNKRIPDNNEIAYSSYRTKDEKQHKKDDVRNSVDPAELPDIMRPVSSLSKFGILPRIPATPVSGAARNMSPAESELEMDLLSSFAQQMILDSSRGNADNDFSSKTTPMHKTNTAIQNQSHVSRKSPVSRTMEATTTSTKVQQKAPFKRDPKPPPKQNYSSHFDGPLRKKSRTTTTSVFNRNSNPSKIPPEPKEGQDRLKIALKLPGGRRVERYFSPTDTINDIMSFAQIKMRIPMSHCDIYSMVQVPKVLIKNWKKTLEQLNIRDRTVLYIDKKDEYSL